MRRGTFPNGTHATDRRAGFTLLELLVYLTLSSLVVGSVFKLVVSQNQQYRHQQEFVDVRDNLRSALVVLTSELRQLAAADADLYVMSAESLAIRSIHWTGIVCGRHTGLPRYGLWKADGEVDAAEGDSALVFAAGSAKGGDDAWKVVAVTKDWKSGGGVPTCQWLASPEHVVEVAGDTTGVLVGAPIRGFRRVQYGIFNKNGRWWLGRKLGGASTYQKMAGPLRPPSVGGLELSYYDAAGGAAADSAQVRSVEIIIRGESFGKVRGGSSGVVPAARRDSLRSRVFLRG